eukprot:gnl/TRDRNA2_/TRDRNA2_32933_c0_seq2.p2 gnl/TRDRNA2_/TRDRNA2_32933_c0~~gnl/TRDRNA2_/TRDRNA2_32933_c0_seq2.p2  ORF type:complete len:198 (+),score=32.81 gnl/TRDRNA2_/TRDRNA2_32933_c0_seq2:92-685(+)
MPDEAVAENLTVEITSGIAAGTNRVELKKRMILFGEVDVCHMGTRGKDNPFVRFRTTTAAEAAVRALRARQVYLEDGSVLAGDFKLGARRYVPPVVENADKRRRDEIEDMTSRELIMAARRNKPAKRSRSRRRHRSRSRSRRSSRSRSRSRSRGKKKKKRKRSRSRSRSSEVEAPPSQPEDAEGATYVNPLFKNHVS